MDELNVDFEQLGRDILAILKAEMHGLLEGVQSDVDDSLKDVALNMVHAIREGDERLKDEIRATARVICETNRVRAAQTYWNALEQVIGVTIDVASVALRAVVL